MSNLDIEFHAAIARLREESDRRATPRDGVTVRQMEAMAYEFRDLLVDAGVRSLDDVAAAHCGRYLYSPTASSEYPADHTVVNRRVVLRSLLEGRRPDLRLDPVAEVTPVPSRPARRTRPLTDEEMALAQRTAARGVTDTRLALAQACVSTGQVCEFSVSDVDDPRAPVTVTDDEGRVFLLTEWGSEVIARRIAHLNGEPGALLAYEGGEGSTLSARRAAASKSLRGVLDAAGLSDDPSVLPRSITYWGANRLRGLGESAEAVAELLGVKVEALPDFAP